MHSFVGNGDISQIAAINDIENTDVSIKNVNVNK